MNNEKYADDNKRRCGNASHAFELNNGDAVILTAAKNKRYGDYGGRVEYRHESENKDATLRLNKWQRTNPSVEVEFGNHFDDKTKLTQTYGFDKMGGYRADYGISHNINDKTTFDTSFGFSERGVPHASFELGLKF